MQFVSLENTLKTQNNFTKNKIVVLYLPYLIPSLKWALEHEETTW